MSRHLNKYIKKWELKSVKKIASTFTSDVYLSESKHGITVLKILNEVGIKGELPGVYFLANCEGQGCVRLFEFDEQALLMEYLPGKNLYQYSKNGREYKASKVFCEIIKKIHLVERNHYSKKLKNFTKLFAVLKKVEVLGELKELMEHGADLAHKLVSTQNKEVLLHGDLHHENIISRENGEFACFDPKGFLGDPCYELGTILKNPWSYPNVSQNIENFQERAKFFSKELELPCERVIGFSFVHLCLSIAWAIQDDQNFDHQLTLAQKVRKIL